MTINHRPPGLLLTLLLALPFAAPAQVQLQPPTRTNGTVHLQWNGGTGPFLLETSQDLVHWSDYGEPEANHTRSLPGTAELGFHRVRDLDPVGARGEFFGLIQTEQGEFGSIMARHRLKTRMWLHKTQAAPHTSPSYTPANYWRKLLMTFQYVDNGFVRTWSGPLEERGTVEIPASDRLTVAWTLGTNGDRRSYLLRMDFPYQVNTSRTVAPLASDPTYQLQCAYDRPQPELVPFVSPPHLTFTNRESVGLVQMDPANYPPPPEQSWTEKKYQVSTNGVRVDLHFLEGVPLYQGSPPWILKTLLLDRWLSATTINAAPIASFTTDSYFARTLLPGHHNFWESVLIEPELDPTLPAATRQALRDANIGHIWSWKDLAGVSIGGATDTILLIGFDNSVREKLN